jgi:hypothetical protein
MSRRLLPACRQGDGARRRPRRVLRGQRAGRALQELARIAQQADADTLRATRRANQIVFEVGGMVLTSRLIEGQFPNYRQLLPRRTSTSCAWRAAR